MLDDVTTAVTGVTEVMGSDDERSEVRRGEVSLVDVVSGEATEVAVVAAVVVVVVVVAPVVAEKGISLSFL